MADTQDNSSHHAPTLKNKKAYFNYDLLETVEAGIILEGTEVKSLRLSHASLAEAYIRVTNGQAWLVGATIEPYEKANIKSNHDPKRRRELLLHKREIAKLEAKTREKGLTIVPVKLYFTARGFAKLQIALAKGKALHDKRQSLKDRDAKRDLARATQKYR